DDKPRAIASLLGIAEVRRRKTKVKIARNEFIEPTYNDFSYKAVFKLTEEIKTKTIPTTGIVVVIVVTIS
ncbi:MAG: hypothetical protein KBT06_11815, partial [Prevotellaceae bacterium]|nr:hypothetical protein [Candidatus Colivivens equi]